MATYRGIYINLGKCVDRAHHLKAQLKRLGVEERYRRFEAIDGSNLSGEYNTTLTPGELGCWLSHVTVLARNAESKAHLHILEDDTLFAPGAVEWLDNVLMNPAGGLAGDWDLLFTDVVLAPHPKVFEVVCGAWRRFLSEGRLTILRLKGVAFAGTSSFIVRHRSIARLYDLLKDGWSSSVPIDLYIHSLVQNGAIEARVTLPFLTSISEDASESSIRGELDKARLALDIFRRSIFLAADLEACKGQMCALIRDVELSPAVASRMKHVRGWFMRRYARSLPQSSMSQIEDRCALYSDVAMLLPVLKIDVEMNGRCAR